MKSRIVLRHIGRNYHLEFYVPFTSRNPLSGNRFPSPHVDNPLGRFSLDLLANWPLGEIIWITPPAPPIWLTAWELPPTAERDALLATTTCRKRQRSLGMIKTSHLDAGRLCLALFWYSRIRQRHGNLIMHWVFDATIITSFVPFLFSCAYGQ